MSSTTAASAPPAVEPANLSALVIALLKGVLYQDDDPALWSNLQQLQAQVRDYIAVLGLDLILDDAEGYAFLRARPDGEGASDTPGAVPYAIPRLVPRRPLSFPVSLLLALLRKKLAEFDASGGDTRLVLTRDELIELVRVFLPENSNEIKLIDQIETHLNRIVELGFLRRLKSATSAPASGTTASASVFEVRRILKAFVDAQWLAEFDARLAGYQAQLAGMQENGDE